MIPADSQTAVETSIVDCISSTSTNGAKVGEMAILIVLEGSRWWDVPKFEENRAHSPLHDAPYTAARVE